MGFENLTSEWPTLLKLCSIAFEQLVEAWNTPKPPHSSHSSASDHLCIKCTGLGADGLRVCMGYSMGHMSNFFGPLTQISSLSFYFVKRTFFWSEFVMFRFSLRLQLSHRRLWLLRRLRGHRGRSLAASGVDHHSWYFYKPWILKRIKHHQQRTNVIKSNEIHINENPSHMDKLG